MKTFFISGILVIIFAVGGMVLIFNTSQKSTAISEAATESNVTMVDGKQIIDINAKGGYAPLNTNAKSGVPTVLKVQTNGTYDCSSALRIPDLGYDETLPPSGETAIEIPPQEPGTTINGLCAMGMYHFSITFNT